MPECSRGGEEHAHQAEERGRGRGRKDEKRTKEGGRQERSVLQASRSYRGARLSGANLHRTVKNKKKKKKKRSMLSVHELTGGQTICPSSRQRNKQKHTLWQRSRNPGGVWGVYMFQLGENMPIQRTSSLRPHWGAGGENSRNTS